MRRQEEYKNIWAGPGPSHKHCDNIHIFIKGKVKTMASFASSATTGGARKHAWTNT